MCCFSDIRIVQYTSTFITIPDHRTIVYGIHCIMTSWFECVKREKSMVIAVSRIWNSIEIQPILYCYIPIISLLECSPIIITLHCGYGVFVKVERKRILTYSVIFLELITLRRTITTNEVFRQIYHLYRHCTSKNSIR